MALGGTEPDTEPDTAQALVDWVTFGPSTVKCRPETISSGVDDCARKYTAVLPWSETSIGLYLKSQKLEICLRASLTTCSAGGPDGRAASKTARPSFSAATTAAASAFGISA